MPADSEAARLPDLPRTWRPLGPRLAGILFGSALVIVCLVTWFTFDAETRAKFTVFQISTILFLAALAAAAMNALVRSRVVGTRDGLVVINGYKRRQLEWTEVVAVRLPAGAPWATLDLSDGSTISAMGIQGSDGARAHQAVRELRALADHYSDPTARG
ncbi:PH domain-containing protein [Nocardioides sp. zg-DK7169]|uniref:PH domain-containing protein n=1 Tax=Nocardioides sp. zg-DK7169 TaxID=2736600 RepID=UPI00155268DE|nr:PH domain-containing protein [Nocardioides sp. zg-DK7169]NPC99066.1 PH domain-containing protein [Nocardioides sp. zg-DK7169]